MEANTTKKHHCRLYSASSSGVMNVNSQTVSVKCALTHFSAQCVVHRWPSALSGVSSSHPLKLANTDVFPATCAVFKRATHKSETRFIHFKTKKII